MGITVSGCDNVFTPASFQAPPTTNRRETKRASYLRKEGTVVCGQHGEFRTSYGSEHHIACTQEVLSFLILVICSWYLFFSIQCIIFISPSHTSTSLFPSLCSSEQSCDFSSC